MAATDAYKVALETAAFMAAFERVAKRLVKPPYNYAAKGKRYASLPFLREHKYGELPATLGELIDASIEDEAIANFITLLVMRELAGKRALPRHRSATAMKVAHKRGSTRFTYFDGDLEVRGNFTFEHAVLVLGDLIVDGLIEDARDSTPLLVAGNVRATGMYIGSWTRVGGQLDTDLLHLRFTRGSDTLVVEKRAATKLYIWTPDDSGFAGKLDAKHRVEAFPDRRDAALAKLRPLLVPALAAKLDADEPDMTLLAATVRAGTAIWK